VGVSVEELSARAEILDVLTRYTRGVDRLDMDLVRAAYHPDAYDDHGLYRGDVDGLIRFLSALTQFERTMHFLGNHTVVVDGDAAWTETYCVAWHRHVSSRTGVRRDNVQGIRYLDYLERRQGGWAIARREIVLDWMRVDDVTNPGQPPADWPQGRRDGDDRSVAHFARVADGGPKQASADVTESTKLD
jgi:SnoaL-like protein